MKPKSKGRRNFLLTATAGGAGAAVAAVTLRGQAARKEDVAAVPAQGDGYRSTEHIEKYYKTTEV